LCFFFFYFIIFKGIIRLGKNKGIFRVLSWVQGPGSSGPLSWLSLCVKENSFITYILQQQHTTPLGYSHDSITFGQMASFPADHSSSPPSSPANSKSSSSTSTPELLSAQMLPGKPNGVDASSKTAAAELEVETDREATTPGRTQAASTSLPYNGDMNVRL
jgi:hypothetical protein